MAKIHNTKKRMPLILTKENEMAWMDGENPEEFAKPDIELKATAVIEKDDQLSLF